MSAIESIVKGLQEAIDNGSGNENGNEYGAKRKLVKITPLPHYLQMMLKIYELD